MFTSFYSQTLIVYNYTTEANYFRFIIGLRGLIASVILCLHFTMMVYFLHIHCFVFINLTNISKFFLNFNVFLIILIFFNESSILCAFPSKFFAIVYAHNEEIHICFIIIFVYMHYHPIMWVCFISKQRAFEYLYILHIFFI